MKTVLLLFTGFFLQHAFTQTGNCGTDGMHNQLTERFPEYREKENQNNQLLYNFLTSDHGNQEKTIYYHSNRLSYHAPGRTRECFGCDNHPDSG